MAWYAELKRRRWYCIIEMDAIHEFKKKLYDDWWQSLTPEEHERVLDQKSANVKRIEMQLVRLCNKCL